MIYCKDNKSPLEGLLTDLRLEIPYRDTIVDFLLLFVLFSISVIRARLSHHSDIVPHRLLNLRLRDVKKMYSSRPIVATALRRLQTHEGVYQSQELLLRVNAGQRGACTCHGEINNRDLYLVAGKFSSRRGQLTVRHNKGLVVPWRKAKHLFRQLRPLRC